MSDFYLDDQGRFDADPQIQPDPADSFDAEVLPDGTRRDVDPYDEALTLCNWCHLPLGWTEEGRRWFHVGLFSLRTCKTTAYGIRDAEPEPF